MEPIGPFVVWGALNGLFLIIESLLKLSSNSDKTWMILFKILITFLLICFTWIFFRARSIQQAISIIKSIGAFKGPLFVGNSKDHFFYCIIFTFFLILYEFKEESFKGKMKLFHNSNKFLRYLFYVSAIVLILLFGVFNGGQFIYFQF